MVDDQGTSSEIVKLLQRIATAQERTVALLERSKQPAVYQDVTIGDIPPEISRAIVLATMGGSEVEYRGKISERKVAELAGIGRKRLQGSDAWQRTLERLEGPVRDVKRGFVDEVK